jgi:hypothetical protein
MKNIFLKAIAVLALVGILASCEDVSDMAFDRVAAPVLVIVQTPVTTPDEISVTAFFYELDKSGLLNKDIGIDSIPVAGLSITVANNLNRATLGTLTTDAEGKVTFTRARTELTGITRIDWVGEHKGVRFARTSNL